MTTAAKSFYYFLIKLALNEKSNSRKNVWPRKGCNFSHLSVLYFCSRLSISSRHGIQSHIDRGQGKARNKDNSIFQSRKKRAGHLYKRKTSARHLQIDCARNDAHASVKEQFLWKNRHQRCRRLFRGRSQCRGRTNSKEVHSLQIELNQSVQI